MRKDYTYGLETMLQAIYTERRQQAERDRNARIERYHTTYPDLLAWKEQMDACGARLLQASLFDPEDDALQEERRELEYELGHLKDARLAWLEKKGIDPTYDQPQFACPTCSDTGEVGEKPCPACYQKTLVPLLFTLDKERKLPEGSWEQFDLTLFRDEVTSDRDYGMSPRQRIEQVRSFCEPWSRHLAEAKKDLLFLGPTGSGKSFMAAAILRQVLSGGNAAIYQTAAGFFEIIHDYRLMQQSFSPDPERYETSKAKFGSLYQVPLLVIDDLGREPNPHKSNPELLELLDQRHNAGCRTIIASNLSLGNLMRTYDERLTSRLVGHSQIFAFPGSEKQDDLRIPRNTHRRAD